MSHLSSTGVARTGAAVIAVGLGLGLSLGVGLSCAEAQTVKMGGGYANVVPIATNDRNDVEFIAGALFKPSGPGPFPTVVYMSGCAGFSVPPEKLLQQRVVDHMLARGVATLIVDPFTPRGEMQGVCAALATHPELAMRGAKDVRAAVNFLKMLPDVDRTRIVLQGYSYGAVAVLIASSANNPTSANLGATGVVAYYPFCGDKSAFSVPTLIQIGDKDDWTPAALCEAIKGRPNVEVVTYPGATHGFVMPMPQPAEYLGHRMAYDEKATNEAEKRADAFLDARLRPTIDEKALRALLTRPNGWVYEERPGSANVDTAPSAGVNGEIVFSVRGDALVATVATEAALITANKTCESLAKVSDDVLAYDSCFRTGIRLRYDPTDKDYPLKGGSSRYDFRLTPKKG